MDPTLLTLAEAGREIARVGPDSQQASAEQR